MNTSLIVTWDSVYSLLTLRNVEPRDFCCNIRIGTVSHLVVHVYVLERRLPYIPADGTATTRERDVELCG